MRVIAGQARGVPLYAPEGREVRPTLDRVRESLFAIIGPGIEGATFLDLFAGTGANGIEALSRGAASADFVDSDPAAVALIRKNLEKTRLGTRGVVHRLSLPGSLEKIAAKRAGHYDVVFADPPYDFAGYPVLIETVGERALLAPGGCLIVEHETRNPMPSAIGGLHAFRTAKYGECSLTFYA